MTEPQVETILNAYKKSKGLVGHVIVNDNETGKTGRFVPLNESAPVGTPVRGYVVGDTFVPLNATRHVLFLETFDEQPAVLTFGTEECTQSCCTGQQAEQQVEVTSTAGTNAC